MARYIAYFRGRNEDHKINELITSATVMGLSASAIATIASPALFEYLAGNGFDTQGEISAVIKIMIFTIPATILLNVAVGVYRGFDRTNVNMYFNKLLRPLSLLIFSLAAMHFGLSFHGIVFMDLLSMIFTFGVMSVYFIKKPPFEPKLKFKFSEPTKELFRYSFPILITSTLINFMTWTATIMLGYFKSAEVVGVYNAVSPLAGFLAIIVSPMGFVYVPVVSKLWGKQNRISRAYLPDNDQMVLLANISNLCIDVCVSRVSSYEYLRSRLRKWSYGPSNSSSRSYSKLILRG